MNAALRKFKEIFETLLRVDVSKLTFSFQRFISKRGNENLEISCYLTMISINLRY